MESKICFFCGAPASGNYCSNCGKKAIKKFNQDNFLMVYDYITDNQSEFISDDFKEVLERYPFGHLPSKTRLINIMFISGYLVRVVEERFGKGLAIHNESIDTILKNKNLSQFEKKEKIVDYIDSQSNMISLDGVDKKILIIPKIIDLFNLIVEDRFNNFFGQSKREGMNLSKSIDMEAVWEISFRNAVWGYLFRMVEKTLF